MEFIYSMKMGLYKMGFLNSDLHLKPIAFLFFIIVAILTISQQIRYSRLSPEQRAKENAYFGLGVCIFLLISLVLLKAYTYVLVSVLLSGFYLIVLGSKRYTHIRKKINELF